jgi:hypothetical protein
MNDFICGHVLCFMVPNGGATEPADAWCCDGCQQDVRYRATERIIFEGFVTFVPFVPVLGVRLMLGDILGSAVQ